MYPTKIGKLTLPHFIYNAAGVWDTSAEQCKQIIGTPECGALVTKSCTVEPRTGNQYPKYHFRNKYFSLNSNGLENHGIDYYLSFATDKIVFYSVGGLCNAERIEIVRRIINNAHRDNVGIEFNMSCPNLGGSGPAYSAESLDAALQELFTAIPVIPYTFGLKLPPYYLPSEFEAIGNVLEKWQARIDFITCINSIPNGVDFDIDNNMPTIFPNDGHGGVGGLATLPIGLANVRRFSKLFAKKGITIDIVGCGGVKSGAEAYKYLLAGAKAVQVGTHLWKYGPWVFQPISTEFTSIMQRKGYTTISEVPSV